MKTKVITTALFLMFFSTMIFASAPNRMLTFQDSYGRTLTMPVVSEEAYEVNLPFDLNDVFKRTRLEEVNTTIDISGMIKPEPEVNDIPDNLKDVIR